MKTVSKIIVALACAIALTGCNVNVSEELGIEPIRVDVDRSKTEVTDVVCTVKDLSTKEYDVTVGGTGVGYGYIPSKGSMGVGVGIGGNESVKHVVEYYVTVEDCNGTVCRFAIDELDWKTFKVDDEITIKEVQEYSKGGTSYNPYYTFMGKKLTIQVLNTTNEKKGD